MIFILKRKWIAKAERENLGRLCPFVPKRNNVAFISDGMLFGAGQHTGHISERTHSSESAGHAAANKNILGKLRLQIGESICIQIIFPPADVHRIAVCKFQ